MEPSTGTNGVCAFYADEVTKIETTSRQDAADLFQKNGSDATAMKIVASSSLGPGQKSQLIASLCAARNPEEIDRAVFDISQLSRELEPEFYGQLIEDLLGSPEKIVEDTQENNSSVGEKIGRLLGSIDKKIEFDDQEFYRAMSLVALGKVDKAKEILNSPSDHRARESLSLYLKTSIYDGKPLVKSLICRMKALCAYLA